VRKSTLIRELQAELASQNRDLWLLTDDNYKLRDQLREVRAEVARMDARAERAEAEVRKWKARRMVAEQKLGYEEKLRARAEEGGE